MALWNESIPTKTVLYSVILCSMPLLFVNRGIVTVLVIFSNAQCVPKSFFYYRRLVLNSSFPTLGGGGGGVGSRTTLNNYLGLPLQYYDGVGLIWHMCIVIGPILHLYRQTGVTLSSRSITGHTTFPLLSKQSLCLWSHINPILTSQKWNRNWLGLPNLLISSLSCRFHNQLQRRVFFKFFFLKFSDFVFFFPMFFKFTPHLAYKIGIKCGTVVQESIWWN